MTGLIPVVQMFLYLLIFAIFARSLLTWFPIDRNGPIYHALDAITEPILQPLRRIIPPLGMIDITPLVASILLLVIVQALGSSA